MKPAGNFDEIADVWRNAEYIFCAIAVAGIAVAIALVVEGWF